MSKKVDVKKRIKILSWSSVLGLLLMTVLSVYNAVAYLQNLEQVKIIVELINKNTSPQLKEEVIKSISSQIHSSQIVVGLVSLLGIVILLFVVSLGISIKKETNRRIHAMDWIIED